MCVCGSVCVCEYLCWHQAIKYVSLFAFDWFVAFRVVAMQQPLARHHYTVQQTKKLKLKIYYARYQILYDYL